MAAIAWWRAHGLDWRVSSAAHIVTIALVTHTAHTNDIVLCVFLRWNSRMPMTAFNVVVSPVFSTLLLPLMLMMMEDRWESKRNQIYPLALFLYFFITLRSASFATRFPPLDQRSDKCSVRFRSNAARAIDNKSRNKNKIKKLDENRKWM